MNSNQTNYLNILEAIFDHAQFCPDKLAFSNIEGRDIDKISVTSLTYLELYLKAYNLSVILRKKTKPGDRVFLCYPSGLDFIVAFYASLLANLIAVPVVVPSNLGAAKKFAAIFEDSKPSLLLADTKTQDAYLHETLFESVSNVDLSVIATDALIFNANPSLLDKTLPKIDSDDVAFLQYTSGSTSDPKGVMVTHKNLLCNISDMSKAYNTRDCLTWLPHTHDMGLIGNLLQCSYLGMTMNIFSPLTFIRNPIFWLQCIGKFHVNATSVPNFALNMCLEKITSDTLKSLDLSSLTCLTVGAEIISKEVLTKFADVFAKAGFNKNAFAPSYGLAEGTLMVSSGFGIRTLDLDNDALSNNRIDLVANGLNSKQIVSCGKPFQKVRIVKPGSTEICDENEVGEVLINGSSVTKGYWGKQNITEKLFHSKLFDGDLYFRTGDLGFLYQEELYITGRIKDVIIINGLNYYPHDIEDCVKNCDPLIKNAPVVSFSYRPNNAESTDSFVVLINPPRKVDLQDLEPILIKARIAVIKEFQLIPHDIQLVNFNFPKTTSGKIQRNLCRMMYEDKMACEETC